MSDHTVSLEYLAGFFDGEGCVSLTLEPESAGRSFRMNVSCSQKRPPILFIFEEVFGGMVGYRKQTDVYIWQITGPSMEKFVKKIMPYSVVKQEEMKIFLEAREMLSGRKVTDEQYKERQDIVQRMKEAKKNGFDREHAQRSLSYSY